MLCITAPQMSSQTGVSPYRQMPVITRDQESPSGCQNARSQQRQAQTQQYLQPPNRRLQRKMHIHTICIPGINFKTKV